MQIRTDSEVLSEKCAQALKVIIIEDVLKVAELFGDIVPAINFGRVAIEVGNDGPDISKHARLVCKSLFDGICFA